MPIAATSLEKLLADAAAGDRSSFRTLYEATSGKLFGIILRICRNRTMAEEVLQEAYLKIWQRAASYDAAAGAPIGWMAAIARNAAIDAVRRRVEVPLGTDADGADLMERVADPAGEGADPVARQALARCLEGLAEEHRRCLLLAYVEGYSREELGARFDRPVGTIKTWLHRGLASLRECLDR